MMLSVMIQHFKILPQQTKTRNVLLLFIYIYDAVYHNPNLAGQKRQKRFLLFYDLVMIPLLSLWYIINSLDCNLTGRNSQENFHSFKWCILSWSQFTGGRLGETGHLHQQCILQVQNTENVVCSPLSVRYGVVEMTTIIIIIIITSPYYNFFTSYYCPIF